MISGNNQSGGPNPVQATLPYRRLSLYLPIN